MQGVDVKSMKLTPCGKYCIITPYTSGIYLFDIFTQLMYDCNNPYLGKFLSLHSTLFRDENFISCFNPERCRYNFVTLSPDFSKAYLTRKSGYSESSQYVLCLVSGYVYAYNWTS